MSEPEQIYYFASDDGVKFSFPKDIFPEYVHTLHSLFNPAAAGFLSNPGCSEIDLSGTGITRASIIKMLTVLKYPTESTIKSTEIPSLLTTATHFGVVNKEFDDAIQRAYDRKTAINPLKPRVPDEDLENRYRWHAWKPGEKFPSFDWSATGEVVTIDNQIFMWIRQPGQPGRS